MEMTKKSRGLFLPQAGEEFRPNSFSRRALDEATVSLDHSPGFIFHGELQDGGETKGPEHPQGVLAEGFLRAGPQDSFAQVTQPVQRVDEACLAGATHIFQMDGDGVDRKIPPPEVFENILPLHGGEVEFRFLLFLLEDHPPGPKGLIQREDMAADLPSYLLDQIPHLSRNRKIKIFPQRPTQEVIPDRPPHEIDLFLSLLCQPTDCFQDLGFFQQLYCHYPSYPQTPVRGEFTTGRNIS